MYTSENFIEKLLSKEVSKQEAVAFFENKSKEEKRAILNEVERRLQANALSESSDFLNIKTNVSCDNKQKEFIENFIDRYERRTQASKNLASDFRRQFSDQRTPIYFNYLLKEIHYPLTYEKAMGAYLEDVDGNEYIDIAGDFGVNLFGHQPPFLKEALKTQLDKGWALSGRYGSITRAAELFCELTGNERVAFCQSGTESLMTATRIAKAATGKHKVVMFDGSYHGHFDGFLSPYVAGVSETYTNDTLVLNYGDLASLDVIKNLSSELAAIVIEPIQSRFPDRQPKEFLQKLRNLTRENNIVLIFDEMITGFRMGNRGCQALFDIDADLTTYGKILGGGITAGAVAGKAELLKWADGGNWQYGDDSKPSLITFMAGTHTQNPLKMAASLAILEEIKRTSPQLHDNLNEKTHFLVTKVNRFLHENRIPFDIVHCASLFRFRFYTEQFTVTEGLFLHLLNENGIRYNLHGSCFLTTAHTDDDVNKIIQAICDSALILVKEGFFYKEDNPEQSIVSPPNAAPSIEKPIVKDNSPVNNVIRKSDKIKPKVPTANTLHLTTVVESVRDIIAKLIRADSKRLDIDEKIENFVADSIMTMKIIRTISEEYKVKLFPVDTRDANTIYKLAAFLCDKHSEKLIHYFGSAISDSNDENVVDPACDDTLKHHLSSLIKKDMEAFANQSAGGDFREAMSKGLDFEEVMDDVQRVIAKLLRADPKKLDVDERIENFVADSIMTMKMIRNISEKYGIKLFPVDTRDANTITKLAEFLCLKYEKELSHYFKKTETVQENNVEDAFLAHFSSIVNIPYEENVKGYANVDDAIALMVSNNFDKISHFYHVNHPSESVSAINEPPAAPLHKSLSTDIAIVGISNVFAGADDPESFWDVLINKKSTIKENPQSRWDWDTLYSKEKKQGASQSKWGAFIDDFDKFDHEFFDIDLDYAKYMDPQVRILLEKTYHLFEDAGIDASNLSRSDVGVFIGYEFTGYNEHLKEAAADVALFKSSSNYPYILANQISTAFDLNGPSEAIHTDCASSGVTISRAYNALLSGECDLAVAGAVCLHLREGEYIAASDIMSPTGTCKVFDDDVDGFTKGEGCGLILLKRLDEAEKAGDHIYAVIKSTAQKYAGKLDSISDINPDALTEAINACYSKVNIPAETVDFIEVDGFCSKWGDSYEYSAIHRAFPESTENKKTCALGSLKSNIGHLEPASGIAGTIKLALSLSKGMFPPTIGFSKVNEFIDIHDDSHPFYLNDQAVAFSALEKDTPVRAGISSVGGSGVNVHILLEEYKEKNVENVACSNPQLFVFSAKDKYRLSVLAKQWITFLQHSTVDHDPLLNNMAYTLQVGRQAMNERLVVLASSVDEILNGLNDFLNKKNESDLIFLGTAKDESSINSIVEESEINALIKNQHWRELARHWVVGGCVSWDMLYEKHKPKRIPLPTCTFKKTKVWLDVNKENVLSVE